MKTYSIEDLLVGQTLRKSLSALPDSELEKFDAFEVLDVVE